MSAEDVRNFYRRQGQRVERLELLKIIEAELKRDPDSANKQGLQEATRIIQDRSVYGDIGRDSNVA